MVYVPGNKQVAADTLSRRKCLAGLALMTMESGGGQSLEDSLSVDMRTQLQELKVMPRLSEVSGVECDDCGVTCKQQAGAMSVLSEPALISWF